MGELTTAQMEAEMNLSEYALWERQTGINLGYKPPPSVLRKGARTPQISDDEAMDINRALGAMEKGHGRDHNILFHYYILGYTDHEIAEKLRVSHHRAMILRCAALKAWFYCWRGIRQNYKMYG